MSITPAGLSEIFTHLPFPVAIYDSQDLNIAFVNRGMLSLWERSDDLIGRTLGDVFPEYVEQGFEGLLRQVWISGETYTGKETPAKILTDGELVTRYFDFEYRALRTGEGHTYAVLHTATEVSERMLAWEKVAEKEKNEAALNDELMASNEELQATMDELSETFRKLILSHEQLEKSESQLREIMSSAPIGLGVVEVHGYRIQSANAHFLALLDADSSVEGSGFADVLSPETFTFFKGLVDQVVGTRQSYARTDVQTFLEGHHSSDKRYHNIVYQPIFGASGDVSQVLIVASEVTAQRRAKLSLDHAYKLLSQSEDRLNLAIQSAQIGTWQLDVVHSIVHWDDRTRMLYGFAEDESVAYHDVLRYIHPSDRDAVENAIARSLSAVWKEEYDVKFRTVDAQGEMFRWVHSKGKAYFDASGKPTIFSGIILDITETMVSRARTDEFNRLIAQKERKLQLIVDSAKVGTYTFNLKTKAVQLNSHSRKLFGFTHREIISEESPIEQTVAEYIPMAIKAMETAIRENTPYDYSYQIVDKLSGEVKWLRSVGNAVGVSSPDMFYGVIIDITSQKNEEKRKTDFLGIASHELRSPLTALAGYLQILVQKSGTMPLEKFQVIVQRAEKQATRMRTLIDGFLNISNIEEGKVSLRLEQMDLKDILRDVEATFVDTVLSHRFSFLIPEDAIPVCVDRNKIEQVIVNFLNNAVKYTPTGTEVTVKVKMGLETVTLRVMDEGPGITQEEQLKLFEKFYRVDERARRHVSGFGIGLYISKEIVLLHEGDIGVESALNVGSTFWFSLPLQLKATT